MAEEQDGPSTGVVAVFTIFVIVVLLVSLFFGMRFFTQPTGTKVDVDISVPKRNNPVPAPSK